MNLPYLQNSFHFISFKLFYYFHLQVTALLTILLSRLADLYFQLNLKKLLMFLLPFHAVSMIVFSVCILTADPEVNNEGNQEPPQIVFWGRGGGSDYQIHLNTGALLIWLLIGPTIGKQGYFVSYSNVKRHFVPSIWPSLKVFNYLDLK